MSAAGATGARRQKQSREYVHLSRKTGEPVSFHLAYVLGNDFVLPEGKNSVDVLRSPFLSSLSDDSSTPTQQQRGSCFNINTGIFNRKSSNPVATKLEFWTKKFNSAQSASHDFEKTWQDRLIVVAEKRLFIITTKIANKADVASSDLEIVDSIPMEDIHSISLESDEGNWGDESAASPATPPSQFLTRTASIITSIKRKYRARPDDKETAEQDRKANQQATERNLRQSFRGAPSSTLGRLPCASHHNDYCDSILRIETVPEGFNRGHTYYFLVRKQEHPTVDVGGGLAPLRTVADAEMLVARLRAVATRCRGEHERETRFLRMQARSGGGAILTTRSTGSQRRTGDAIPPFKFLSRKGEG